MIKDYHMQCMRNHEEHSSCLPRLLCSHLLHPISTDQLSLLFQAGLQNTFLTCLLIYTQAQEPLFSGRDWPEALDLSSQDLTQESGFFYPFQSGMAEEPSEVVLGWLHLLFLFWEIVKVCVRLASEAWGRGYETSIQCLGGRGVEWSVSYCVAQASLELSM